jgi:hypothetical protein
VGQKVRLVAPILGFICFQNGLCAEDDRAWTMKDRML